MDNVQREYLLQYTAAMEVLLGTGDRLKCLDTLLELRMKPDLSPYVRAMANISICDFNVYSKFPDVMELSTEAVRIAAALKVSTAEGSTVANSPKESAGDDGSFWFNKIVILEQEAERAWKQAEAEKDAFCQAIVNSDLENDSDSDISEVISEEMDNKWYSVPETEEEFQLQIADQDKRRARREAKAKADAAMMNEADVDGDSGDSGVKDDLVGTIQKLEVDEGQQKLAFRAAKTIKK